MVMNKNITVMMFFQILANRLSIIRLFKNIGRLFIKSHNIPNHAIKVGVDEVFTLTE